MRGCGSYASWGRHGGGGGGYRVVPTRMIISAIGSAQTLLPHPRAEAHPFWCVPFLHRVDKRRRPLLRRQRSVLVRLLVCPRPSITFSLVCRRPGPALDCRPRTRAYELHPADQAEWACFRNEAPQARKLRRSHRGAGTVGRR